MTVHLLGERDRMLRRFLCPTSLKVDIYFVEDSLVAFSSTTACYAIPQLKYPGFVGSRSSAAGIRGVVKDAFAQCHFNRFRFRPARRDFGEEVAGFKTEMERFRGLCGLSEGKFHKQLGLIKMEKIRHHYLIWPQLRTHRRFAFEGACKMEDRAKLPGSTDEALLGDELTKTMESVS